MNEDYKENLKRIIEVIGYTGKISAKVCFIGIEPGGEYLPITDSFTANDIAPLLYEKPEATHSKNIIYLTTKEAEKYHFTKEDLQSLFRTTVLKDWYEPRKGHENALKLRIFNQIIRKKNTYCYLASRILGANPDNNNASDIFLNNSFQINLFPLPKASFSNWPAKYHHLFGNKLNDYYKYCHEYRFPLIKKFFDSKEMNTLKVIIWALPLDQIRNKLEDTLKRLLGDYTKDKPSRLIKFVGYAAAISLLKYRSGDKTVFVTPFLRQSLIGKENIQLLADEISDALLANFNSPC